MKKFLKLILIILLVIVVLAAAFVAFLSLTEFKPELREPVARLSTGGEEAEGESFTIYTWNTGYGGLGKESDFFMDGGEMVAPPSAAVIEKNLAGISEFISTAEADAWLLQEVDTDSARTGREDQFAIYASLGEGSAAFAYNYRCPFVPIPLPPMGRVHSGVATLTDFAIDNEAVRVSLPCPFDWPVRAAQIKRCLLITRLPLEGRDEQLVLVNLHLEAYDDGEGKKAQTDLLINILEEEYAKGNYVVAGGDFNQSFPGVLDRFPILDESKWTPGILGNELLPEGWSFVYDSSAATCRLLDAPYNGENQKYVIDGFIISPNLVLEEAETVDLDFEYSDHNPVKLRVSLGE